MIDAVISFKLIEWIMIISFLVFFIIYSKWSSSKYNELAEENKLLNERLELKSTKLYVTELGYDFSIMIQSSYSEPHIAVSKSYKL